MHLFVHVLMAMLFAASAFAQSRLTIDRLDREDIGEAIKETAFSTILEGTVDDPRLAVYVLVSSPGNTAVRSFPALVDTKKIDPAGGYRWRAICQFGRYDGPGVGLSYQVRVAAIDPKRIKRNGNILESLSTHGIQSNAISIKRVKK